MTEHKTFKEDFKKFTKILFIVLFLIFITFVTFKLVSDYFNDPEFNLFYLERLLVAPLAAITLAALTSLHICLILWLFGRYKAPKP